MSTDAYTKHVLQICVAQICQMIGWNSIHSTALYVTTDILRHYIRSLARIMNNYCSLYGQTEPNLDHLALAFNDMGISVAELEEYVQSVDSLSCVIDVPQYPIPCESHLNFLKPGSREVLTRPVHIHEHLPPMHPHLEENDPAPQQSSPLSVDILNPTENTSPLASPQTGVFKRPGDPISSESSLSKRQRVMIEEESRPLRELSSVMMTTSGFLSPAREGKLPEARNPPQIDIVKSPEMTPPVEIIKEKKKKNKTLDPMKKTEKENKIKEEPIDDNSVKPEETKIKKLVNVKDISKLKALKSNAIKIPSVGHISKSHKSKTKSPQAISNKSKSHNRSPKTDKSTIPPFPKEHHIQLTNDLYASTSMPDGKLPSEPDKSKLNIFKKISKVKEEPEESKHETVYRESLFTQIDETIESVIQHSKSPEENLDILTDKDDTFEVDVLSTSPHSDLLPPPFFEEKPPLAIPKTPDIPKAFSEHKKKKKDKHKEKKDSQKGSLHSPKISKMSCLPEPELPPKAISPDRLFPEAQSFGTFSLFPSFRASPGLIPPPISHPLIPHLPLPISKHSSSPSFPIPHPLLSPVLPTLETPAELNKIDLPRSSSPLVDINNSPPKEYPLDSKKSEYPNEEPMPQDIGKPAEPLLPKKKEHKKDKKLKDKVKKKKDKKDKSKNKDKSEKKKSKNDKKKDKEKSKLKKEKKEKKKKEALQADDKSDLSTSVTKITFKLSSLQDNTPDTLHRKIVIKHVVRKEEDTKVPERPLSPELAKISPLITRPSKEKTKVPTVDEPKPSTPSTTYSQPKHSKVEATDIKVEPEETVWICPACGGCDDGSAMIACDSCDLWYHWVCVGIREAIESDWYCQKCSSKDEVSGEKKKKHRKKKI